MNNTYASMTVIGAGSYGTALSIVLANNGHNVVLWDHNEQHVDMLKIHRSNIVYLPKILLPKSIYLEKNLHNALSASKNILVVVPSHVFGRILKKMKPIMRQDARVVWATKGLEPETGRLLQDVAREILGQNIPLAVISGPAFARELAQGLPTEILISSTDQTFSEDLQQLFHCDESFHVYKNIDVIGIQISGVIKNVIAIAVGISDGIGFGSNARMSLIIRGLNEISRLGASLGAHSSTFFGMAGLGDLVLTCTDNQSRNRRFGLMIGQGVNIKYAKYHINQVVEGFYNTKEVRKLAQRFDVSMPIIEETYQILYCQKDMRKAIRMMLSSIYK